jgi:hypothetical protein
MMPSFSGFVFIDYLLSRVKGLVVMGRFHLARAAIFPQVTGLRKNVGAFFGIGVGQRLGVIRPQRVERLRKHGGLGGGLDFGGGVVHKFR